MSAEGTVPLGPSDLETLRLVDPHRDTKPGRAEPGIGETLIYNNITVGQANMAGNTGVENWYNSNASSSPGDQKPASGFVFVGDDWVKRDGKSVMWLPADYRATWQFMVIYSS